MSELGSGDDDGKEVGGSGPESGDETEPTSSAETSSSVEDSGALEGTCPTEGIGVRGDGGPTGPTETGGGKGIENVSVSPREVSRQSHEGTHGKSQILETSASLEQAQKDVESYHQQSIEQILAINGKYMSEEDRARVEGYCSGASPSIRLPSQSSFCWDSCLPSVWAESCSRCRTIATAWPFFSTWCWVMARTPYLPIGPSIRGLLKFAWWRRVSFRCCMPRWCCAAGYEAESMR